MLKIFGPFKKRSGKNGKNPHKSKGFTFDVKTREEYFELVSGIISGRSSYDGKEIK